MQMKTLIFDTETTGLVKSKLTALQRQPFIIELYCACLDDERNSIFVKGHHSLYKPPLPISEEITKITGIKNMDVEECVCFSVDAKKIKNLFEVHDEIVAHNMSFDKTMIDIEMARCGLKIEWPKLICTVESTEHVKGHRLTLAVLYEHLFGEEFIGAHRAENDVKALARCFHRLRADGVL